MSSSYLDLIKILIIFLFLNIICLGNYLYEFETIEHNGYSTKLIHYQTEAKKIFKLYFESKGFKTGIIKIPELDVEVMLEENQFYKIEEEVQDVYERINEIRKEFDLSTPYRHFARGYGWCGVLEVEYSKEKAYGYIVLINKKLNDASMLYTKAHENGHFLWYIGKQEIIYKKFKKSDIVKSYITNNEDFGNLCGWIALKMAGYNLEECFIVNTENHEAEIRVARLRNIVRNYLID